MTDLGKMGSLGQGSQNPIWGGSCHFPPVCRGFQEVGLLGPWGASVFSLDVSLSDEQEDESMETTGKVEPV